MGRRKFLKRSGGATASAVVGSMLLSHVAAETTLVSDSPSSGAFEIRAVADTQSEDSSTGPQPLDVTINGQVETLSTKTVRRATLTSTGSDWGTSATSEITLTIELVVFYKFGNDWLECHKDLEAPAKGAETYDASHWMWLIATGRPYDGRNIYEDLPDVEYRSREELPESIGMVVAIHRSGVSRMRSVYDHRVRQLGEAEDRGIEDFARRLGDYADHSGTMEHHMAPQHGWLGEEPEVFMDIMPLDRLDLFPEMVGRALGRTLPPLPRIHEMPEKSEVSPEVAELFEQWCVRDRELGWDGKTMKLSGMEDLGRRVLVPGWGGGEGLLIEIPGVHPRTVEVNSSEVKPVNEVFLRRRRFADYVRDWDVIPERAWARVASPWRRVRGLAESLREKEERFSGMSLRELVREEGGLFLEGELDPQVLWLLDDRGTPQVEVEWAQEDGEWEADFDDGSRE